MKRFLLNFITFTVILFIVGEVVVRIFKLTPDIPKLYVDQTGIQRYVPGQKGNFSKTSQWVVNAYGWLGIAETNKDPIISIIGDSYIENMMNPIICNQGSILKSYFTDCGFFEAGRSGVTFIEAMQITKLLDSTIKPTMHLIYVGDEDLYESDASYRQTDRMQINLSNHKIINAELKSPFAKKILYNLKSFYYLYLRFPLLVGKNNKEATDNTVINKKEIDYQSVNNILNYSKQMYDIKKIILIWHPGTPRKIIKIARHLGFNSLSLTKTGKAKNWLVSSADAHWSCYGHQQVAKQISIYITQYLKGSHSKIKMAYHGVKGEN